jgi:hypothetical protein
VQPIRDVGDWSKDVKLIERARIVLAVSLSKRPPGELTRIVLEWLDDTDIQPFCGRYLDDSDLAFITRA